MTDKQLQDSVLAALKWETTIDTAQIGVTVNRGVVALRGEVKTFTDKTAAERVVLGIYGAKAVANDLEVHFPGSLDRSDTDIALAVINALKWSSMVPPDKVTPSVSNGWVTLYGELDWHYQRLAAASAVRDLAGVRGLSNDIKNPSVRQRGRR